jgi:hypothetical protein
MSSGKRLTTVEIIKRFKELHGNRYNYDNVEYITLTDKVSIVCSRHGEFKQTPKNHLKGQNCRKCYLEDTNGNYMKSPEWRKRASDNMKNNLTKIRQGMINKYGEDNPSKVEDINIRRRQYFIDTYNVENPYQLNIKKRIEKTKNTNIENGNWISDEDRRPFDLYKKKVWRETNKSILKYNASWLLEGRSRTGNHLDHVYSIYDGFKNNIEPHIIGHLLNLQILDAKVNRSKGIDSWILISTLTERILNFEKI